MSCSPRRRSWARWRWRRCSPGSRPAGMRSGLSRSASKSREVLGDKQVGGLATLCGDDRNRLAELLSRDLSGLDLVALMIDGVHFAQSCCVVALGIGINGVKHPLALVEGSTENATWSPICWWACAGVAWT